MRVIKESVLDIGDGFIELENKYCHDEQGKFFVKGNIYSNVRYFEYKEDSLFQEKDMYEIFAPEKEVAGAPVEVSWDQCLVELKGLLKHPSFKGERETCLDRIDEPDEKLGKKRVLLLVQELAKHFPIPPEKVYRYDVEKRISYFQDIVPWYFCYVFLDRGRGMVLNMYADI